MPVGHDLYYSASQTQSGEGLNLIDRENVAAASTDLARQLAEAIHSVFVVDSIATGGHDGRTIRLQGRLRTDSHRAYAYIAGRLKDYGYTALLREESEQFTVTALPGVSVSKPTREFGAVVLFALTVLSTLFASASAQAPNLRWILRNPLAGLPFAATLLSILVAHELGHYFVARRVGVETSLPYFIPMPLSLFGTMGAIIRTGSPMTDRRRLLAIGAAGPIAGLIVAIPMLILGLLRSEVLPIPMQEGLLVEGNSLLYLALKLVIFGRILPSNGYDVFLDPVAFAAWAGLLLTSVNLIPAGQLDGGHIAYALLGKRAQWLNRLTIIVTAVLGFVWSGWFLWTALLIIFGQRSAEPLDDVTSLTAPQRAFAVSMLIVFLLLVTPVPLTIL